MKGPQDAVLSIQSHVAYGHVGNSAATLPLQRLGFDIYPVHTVQLAHHPGYGAWRGYRVEPERVADILDGLRSLGALGRCAALLSGYLGDAAMGEPVLWALRELRAERADALYLCDPVIGDDDVGVFVSAGVPELLRERLVPAAGIITPNRFELAHLAQQEVSGLEDAVAAASRLRARGTGIVVATGLPVSADRLGVVAVAAEGAFAVTTPRLRQAPHGTGDVLSALYLGHYLATRSVALALERSVSAMFAVIERTLEQDASELCLVDAQDALLAPRRRFAAEEILPARP